MATVLPEEGVGSVSGRGAALFARQDPDTLVLTLAGRWNIATGLVPTADLGRQIDQHAPVHRVTFDTAPLGAWDSSLVAYLASLRLLCLERGIAFDTTALPGGLGRLVELVKAARQPAASVVDGRSAAHRASPADAVGARVLRQVAGLTAMLTFVGELTLAMGRFFRRKARYRRSDLFDLLQEVGADALPIVTLICLLIGLIIAFIGAIQLRQFGVSEYVANLVGVAMTREMAAVMTAIILAGRSGAAFAARLGTMQGNDEIDALTALGISPMEFLVMPRVLALALMMPLLYAYGSFAGLFGGYLVGIGILDLSTTTYLGQTRIAVSFDNIVIGVVKSVVFGVLVAVAGCLRGMQASRSAGGVGLATTSAVVTGIALVIAADAVFAVLLDGLGV